MSRLFTTPQNLSLTPYQNKEEKIYENPFDRLHNTGRRANNYGYLAKIDEQG